MIRWKVWSLRWPSLPIATAVRRFGSPWRPNRARQAVALADANGDGYLAAYAQRKLGVLYQATGQHEAAAQTVAAVLHFFEEANLPHEIERIHRELGTSDLESDLEKVRLSTPEKNKR